MRRKLGRRSWAAEGRPARTADCACGPKRQTRLWWLVGTAVIVGMATTLLVRVFTTKSVPWCPATPPSADAVVESPEPRPPVPATLLGLNSEPPQTVAELKQEVLQLCQRLVDDLPRQPEAHAVRALFLKRFGSTAEAVQCWRKCLELNPKFSPAYFGLGAVAAEKADYDPAVASLTKALELNADLAGAYSLLTEVLLQCGESTRALDVARQYVRRFPESRESHYWLGQTYLELQEYAQAEQSHQEAIRLDPQLASSYHSLAVACTHLGKQEQAAQFRQQFAALKQTEMQSDRGRNKLYRDLPTQQEVAAGALLSVGNVYLRSQDPRKAEACWLRGASLAAQDLGCRETLVGFYESRNRPRAALCTLDELLGLRPQQAGYWTDRGRLLVRLQDAPQAERAYRQAIAFDPQAGLAYQGLIDLCLHSGSTSAEAVMLAEQAVRWLPCAKSYLQLSAVRQGRGDRRGAIAAIEKAIELEPTDAELRQVLAQLQ